MYGKRRDGRERKYKVRNDVTKLKREGEIEREYKERIKEPKNETRKLKERRLEERALKEG